MMSEEQHQHCNLYQSLHHFGLKYLNNVLAKTFVFSLKDEA